MTYHKLTFPGTTHYFKIVGNEINIISDYNNGRFGNHTLTVEPAEKSAEIIKSLFTKDTVTIAESEFLAVVEKEMIIENKHTKGKWAWQNVGDGYCLMAQHGMREIILSSESQYHGHPVKSWLVMNDDGLLEPIDANHPNAKLIAAAPDMLDALVSISEFLKQGADSGDWGIWKAEDIEAYNKAIAVIKSATK